MSATISNKDFFDSFRVQLVHTHFEKSERRATKNFQVWQIWLTTIKQFKGSLIESQATT